MQTIVDARAPVAREWLSFDPLDMRERFDKEPFSVRHDLAEHPLLQLPRLIELAKSLPEHSVEYNAGDVNVNQDAALTPRTGLSVADTLHRIESCRSWMVLKDVEQDPEYRALLDQCLDQVQRAIAMNAPGMGRRHAFIFVSSPNAVTPFHADFEHNLLLHIRGDKTINVWPPEDRAVMAESERERIIAGGQRNLPYRDELAAKGRAFPLKPGMGVQVPLSSPHWVKVGDQVSVSFSITFISDPGYRVKSIHRVNAFLRRRGLQPREVGASRVLDDLKFAAFRLVYKAGLLLDRVRPARATLPPKSAMG